jgi:hypothetical protein
VTVIRYDKGAIYSNILESLKKKKVSFLFLNKRDA